MNAVIPDVVVSWIVDSSSSSEPDWSTGAGMTIRAMAGPFGQADTIDHFVPADKKLSAEWLQLLTARGGRTWYDGDDLKTIGMPIGGICAGQVYLTGDGRSGLLGHLQSKHQLRIRTGQLQGRSRADRDGGEGRGTGPVSRRRTRGLPCGWKRMAKSSVRPLDASRVSQGAVLRRVPHRLR